MYSYVESMTKELSKYQMSRFSLFPFEFKILNVKRFLNSNTIDCTKSHFIWNPYHRSYPNAKCQDSNFLHLSFSNILNLGRLLNRFVSGILIPRSYFRIFLLLLYAFGECIKVETLIDYFECFSYKKGRFLKNSWISLL